MIISGLCVVDSMKLLFAQGPSDNQTGEDDVGGHKNWTQFFLTYQQGKGQCNDCRAQSWLYKIGLSTWISSCDPAILRD